MNQPPRDPAREKELTQKFIQFIMVQAQNVLFVLGQIPGPDGMAPRPNLEAAKMLIDQMEAIREKTRGNLNPQEEQLFDDTLAEIRMVFVEVSGGTPHTMMPDRGPRVDLEKLAKKKPAPAPAPARAEPPQPSPTPKPSPAPVSSPSGSPDDEEHKKKFYKSYGSI
jgi:hypothetical protein